ncbi:putative membrane protein [Gelidibacter algens]|uniref:Putative membrane protein n=1 Tax=Gelidibacter algens TaxID=49280 RepID=A0A1A7R3V6_9FLAO|nr:DUF2231 domain-containing protein [Gelidibacter algens]OBX26144.1 hypothetical protein A9996_06350 [Gelidibacter algens]RAJ24493.1 putative membrane protein [Gelidibacter algens]
MTAEIPSLWREEVWHPLSVHLPIVALLLASVAAILCLAVKNKVYHLFVKQMTFVMLIIGVFSGWLAIYTGELAYSIEVRKICDPKVLQEHQWWSYATLIVYSVALSLKIIPKFITLKYLNVIKPINFCLLIIALLGLLYTGHLGASLVYQQGAGTYKPTDDCSEFVK